METDHLGARTIFLERSKNGDKRQVPITSVLLAALGTSGQGPLFKGARTSVSQHWARIFKRAKCPDLHFHDLRHEATSRFYERTTLTDLEIGKITGHKDLRSLARYANLRASTLANKLW